VQTHKHPKTTGEHRKILAFTRDRDFRIFLKILWGPGARPLEAARLFAYHIDWVARRLRLHDFKRAADPAHCAGIPLNKWLEEIFRDLPATGFLFPWVTEMRLPEISRYFSILRKQAGLESSTFIHSYRMRLLVKAGRIR
jgi:hypothetical protein